MKQASKRRRVADRPIVVVSEVAMPFASDDNWYTPDVLHLRPTAVSVTLGQEGRGRVRCEIEEAEWERRCFTLRLIFEKSEPDRAGGQAYCTCDMHSDISSEFGSGEAGTFTREQLDQLIRALQVARDEADRRGLFTERPTPTSIADLLAASCVAH